MKREARKTHYFAGTIGFELERKRVRNVNLRIRPDGTVYVSAPPRVPLSEIERFVATKEPWIRRKQEVVRGRSEREASSWEDGGRTRLWGEELTVKVAETASARQEHVALEGAQLVLYVAPRWLDDSEQASAHRERLAQAWLRTQLEEALPDLFSRHEEAMGVHASEVRLRTMKTRWGSCNVRSGAITLNTRLVGFPRRCLEYVVVHELCHLLEPSHNARFHALMDRYYPNWRAVRRELRS